MSRILKYVAIILATVITVAGTVALIYFSGREGEPKDCDKAVVTFTDNYRFLNEDSVKEILETSYGEFIGQRLDKIDIAGIEKILNAERPVLKSEVWVEGNGSLNIRISHRTPVLKLSDSRKVETYVDADGFTFPADSSFFVDLPLIRGAVKADRQWIKAVLELNRHINSSDILKKRITDIQALGNNELTLTDKISGEIIEFGKAEKFESKFSRLEDYYKSIVPSMGEGYYRTVCLKYDKQIICKK